MRRARLRLIRAIFELGVPVLGICYGCQFMAHALGGQVTEAHEDTAREYGKTETYYDTACKLFKGLPERGISWMSHGDYDGQVPEGLRPHRPLRRLPQRGHCRREAGLLRGAVPPGGQSHREHGVDMIRNFLYEVCGAKGDWTMGDYKESSIKAIREKVGGGKVLLALSGGVDSSVAAALLAEAVGSQLTCVFVDHGLMRKNEGRRGGGRLLQVGHPLPSGWTLRPASWRSSPASASRSASAKSSGRSSSRVFEEEAKKIGRVDYLVQGTIYPDVIESGAGDAAVIKSHHNVGGLPDYVDFKGDHRAPAPALQGRGAAVRPRAGPA